MSYPVDELAKNEILQWISKHCFFEMAVEKGIFDIQLMNWPRTRYCNAQNRPDGDRLDD
jgi:hypothetical protein